MAKTILAALRITRNDVHILTNVFERMLKCIGDNSVDPHCRQECLDAFRAILTLEHRAVEADGKCSKAYQKYFYSCIYYGSLAEKVGGIPAASLLNKLTHSLIAMLFLALRAFARLGYPSYYANFASALEKLFNSDFGRFRDAGFAHNAAGVVRKLVGNGQG